MRLTAYTDYSLRTLMYLALNREQLATIQEIADVHGIAKNHLTKVVHQLGMLGYVITIRGRNGGLRLAREPSLINIGEVVRHTETDFHMASCFDEQSSGCSYSAACALQAALGRATSAFLAVLDAVTLEQMLVREKHDPASTASRRPQVVALHLKRAQ
jgi:Rrf2 family transcriptional regulator, nitric oxide-sensitive transcriptional repressor